MTFVTLSDYIRRNIVALVTLNRMPMMDKTIGIKSYRNLGAYIHTSTPKDVFRQSCRAHRQLKVSIFLNFWAQQHQRHRAINIVLLPNVKFYAQILLKVNPDLGIDWRCFKELHLKSISHEDKRKPNRFSYDTAMYSKNSLSNSRISSRFSHKKVQQTGNYREQSMIGACAEECRI